MSYLRFVLDHRPLQQGLRLFGETYTYENRCVLDHRPLQQGLRHL